MVFISPPDIDFVNRFKWASQVRSSAVISAIDVGKYTWAERKFAWGARGISNNEPSEENARHQILFSYPHFLLFGISVACDRIRTPSYHVSICGQ